MRNLINDLLNYSKLSSTSHFLHTDLNTIVNETIADLEHSILEKAAKIEIENLPAAEVIPGQIRQVFQNILSNALKFSCDGIMPEIRIRAEVVAEKSFFSKVNHSGNYVRIYISDNGIGFNPKYVEKIFTIFQQLHGRDAYGGTGIGLAIVKKIIEKHNGIITAESEEGKGTTFIIVLPLKQARSLSQSALYE
jgi:signal transduction histidine kinase